MSKSRKPKKGSSGRSAGATPTATAPPEVEIRQGLAAFQAGRYGAAIEAWQRARRAQPAPGVIQALAEAHFRQGLEAGDPARRGHHLREAVALDPDRVVYHFHLGLTYQRQARPREAIDAFERAYQLAPADRRVRHHLVLALLGDPAGAVRARELLADAPASDEAAARLRALAELRLDDPPAAVATLARALGAVRAPEPPTLLALGLARLAAGQAAAAAEPLAKVLRTRRPQYQHPRRVAGLAAVVGRMRAGDLAGALQLVDRQDESLGPDLDRLWAGINRQLAVELALEERLEEAIRAWEQALARDPRHELTRRALIHLREVAGTRAVRRGDLAAAADHWRAALAGEPGNPRLLRNLALAEERLEHWEQAGARWEDLANRWKKDLQAARRQDETAAELRHRLVVAHRHRAAAHEALGDVRAAARALERALHYAPADDALRLRVAELYLEDDAWGLAIDHLRRVLAARPRDVRVLMELGAALDRKGDERQAFEYLEQARALEPENPAVKSTLASVHHGRAHRLQDSGPPERAIGEYERAIELAPNDSEHQVCLGTLYLRLDRVPDAKAAFARALALDPADPALHIMIAGTYLAFSLDREAERVFRDARRLDDSPMMQAAIGLAYHRFGNRPKAEPYFRRVLRSGDAEAVAMIGQALSNSGSLAEAIPYLERAIALNPLNLETRLSLAYAYAFGRQDPGLADAELASAEAVARLLDDRALVAEIAEVRAVNERRARTGPIWSGFDG